VVGTLLLGAVYRDLGAVHFQHYALWRFDGFRLADQLAIDRGQACEVLILRQQSSVSKDCKREVKAAPRSQIFSEPISRNVGSWETRSASFMSSYPANRLYTDWRNRSASGNCVF